jgi:glycosyltransferase involved in cell wall biosynthesis
MHVLFVHQNYPAQFGHVARHLAASHGFRCTFVSQRPPGLEGGVERIQYHLRGGATARSHYCSRTFENAVWHSHAVFEALKARPDIRPDLVVGHSGFCSTTFLREIYDCPIVNYFEYFYHTTNSDMDFRPDFPSGELERLRARARNAILLLDLENCDIGQSPTRWQHSRLPDAFRPKVRVAFDGVDTALWRPWPQAPRRIGGREVPHDTRVVTYVSRGMESMRGFDIFMKMAKRLADRRRDVVFVVVGEDRVCYGGDARVTGGRTFREWILSQDEYDLSRFLFTGLIPPRELAHVFALSDLHVYLTVPFVLSWSLVNALACGTTVLASDTTPVRELITHGENGLLIDFFDIEAMAETAARVLDRPGVYRHLGEAGAEMVRRHYSMDVCLPQILSIYHDATRMVRLSGEAEKVQ